MLQNATPATRNASFQILFKCPTPAIVFGNATKRSFDKVQNPVHLPRKTTSEPSVDMCFAPHQRALFRHLSFQKCSDVGVFCTF